MELRKDPVTLSWMLVGDVEEHAAPEPGPCPFCEGSAAPPEARKLVFAMPGSGVRVYAHARPLYRIEGEERRAAEGIYDRMRPVGAHEVIVENAQHDRPLSAASDQEVELVLRAYAHRISDQIGRAHV